MVNKANAVNVLSSSLHCQVQMKINIRENTKYYVSAAITLSLTTKFRAATFSSPALFTKMRGVIYLLFCLCTEIY